MATRFRKGRCVFAAIALAVMCFGFATPAMAEGESTYKPGDAMLTAVIVGPAGTDASEDEYVFHFAGGGMVKAQKDEQDFVHVYSPDGVEQDNTTIKEGDSVPTINDVTLKGVTLSGDNSLTNNQTCQTVVQMPISDILKNVVFPHAGVYTYVVTEKSATMANTDGIVNASKAEYILRIWVKNDYTDPAKKDLAIDYVTIQQAKDDDGKVKSEKVNPEYPKATNGKITKTAPDTAPGTNELAGDARGFNVPGFTFANKYIMGGSFQVKKLYDGDYSDRTKYSTVELTIYSAEAAKADGQGSCLTYRIEGEGVDHTETNLVDGEHSKLNGVSGIDDYMVEFNKSGWAYIKADLKEDSIIRITGEFGPYDSDSKKRKTLTTRGLLEGHTYYVIERNPNDYRPTGYVYVGKSDNVDPRTNAANMTTTTGTDNGDTTIDGYVGINDVENNVIPPFGICVTGPTKSSDTTVFVVNKLDNNKVSATGVLIDNLPYVLMIGIPVVVFIALFALKRRRNAVE